MRDKLPRSAGGRLLLGGFLALLLLPWPLWGLLRGGLDTANHENRVKAAFPVLSLSANAAGSAEAPAGAVTLSAWPAAFESWLGDHAPFRIQLMSLNTGLDLLAGSLESSDVLRGRDGWLFLKDVSDSQSLSDYQGLTACTEEELSADAAALCTLNDALQARGIRLVVLFAPAKEGVYDAMLPAAVPAVNRPTRVQGLTAALSARTAVPVVFPLAALHKAAREGLTGGVPVYYKYDTHWNAAGGWLGAQAVLAALGMPYGGALPPAAAEENAVLPRDLADMCAAWRYCTDDAVYTLDAPAAALDESAGQGGEIQVYRGGGTASLLLVRDSYGAALAPWLAAPFGRSLSLHGNQLSVGTLDKFAGRPDVVVVEVAERFYYNLPGRLAVLLDWAEGLG